MTPNPTPPNIPHRKNAAEWLMWLALYPVALLIRLFAAVFAPSRLRG
jgi:hypothetical protein